ncbi:MAG: nodulation protein NfeD [Bradymonadales bacterium]|nr:nodulation protein NfeD [Bradymonadales bacterium]
MKRRRQRVTRPSGRRKVLWLALLLIGSVWRALPLEGQPQVVPTSPAERDVLQENQAEEEEPGHEPPVDIQEPSEVTEARLSAMPVAATARLMAVREAIAGRLLEGAQDVYVAKIHGEIELGIAYYLERAVRSAQDGNGIVLVLEVETPGGRVDAAIMMRDYLLSSEVPTIAFVHNRAWSAGALISLGNDLIIMTRGASIGAATPVQMGGGGSMEPVEEKVVSALRAEFRSAAEATSRSAEIAQAMVDAQIAVGGVIGSGQLLTLTGQEAVEFGFAEGRAENLESVLDLVGLRGRTVLTIDQSWAESLVRVLTSPVVSSLLMTLGILGLFFELTTPGFGWAGAMGLTALAIFFAGHLLVKLAGFEELALFLAGAVLLGIELFVIPGFGIVGVLGLVAIAASLVLSLIGLDLGRIELSAVGLREALIRVGVSFAITILGTVLLMRYIPKTRVGRRLVLAESLAQGPSLPRADQEEEISIGQTGVALTALRPFGRGKFGHRRIEVVSDGEMIARGTPIRVVRIAGQRIEVRTIPSETVQEDEKR